MTGMSGPARSHRLGAALAFAATLAALCALSWPMPVHLSDWHLLTSFGDSHAWTFEWLWRTLAAGELPTRTLDAGFPEERVVRIIGWGPALLYLGLRAAMAPLPAANLTQLLALPLSALAAYALLRRWTGLAPLAAAGLATGWALSPTLLSTYGMGEISNTQAWVLPGLLYLLGRAGEDRRWLLALPPFALASVFSSPYFGLAMPLLVGVWALWRAWRARGEPLAARLGVPAAAVLAVGLGMAPSGLYYLHAGADGPEALFRPAQQASGITERLPFPPPVARPDALVLDREPDPRSAYEAMHVSYLGLPLLVGALVLGRRGRGWAAGVALALGGALLALGPWLAWGDDYVRAGGMVFPLPARVLEILGYPTRKGGMYFRFAVLSTLGLVLVLGAGLAERRRAAALAWGLALLQVLDGVRATGPLWPRPAERVPDLEILSSLRGGEGAVLELPLQGPLDAASGQPALLRALFLERPTSALPRDVRPRESALPPLLERAVASGDPAEALRAEGFGLVILPRVLSPELDPTERALVRALGEPDAEGASRYWILEPTGPD